MQYQSVADTADFQPWVYLDLSPRERTIYSSYTLPILQTPDLLKVNVWGLCVNVIYVHVSSDGSVNLDSFKDAKTAFDMETYEKT